VREKNALIDRDGHSEKDVLAVTGRKHRANLSIALLFNKKKGEGKGGEKVGREGEDIEAVYSKSRP